MPAILRLGAFYSHVYLLVSSLPSLGKVPKVDLSSWYDGFNTGEHDAYTKQGSVARVIVAERSL